MFATALESVRASPGVGGAPSECGFVLCLQTILYIKLGALYHPRCFFCGVREVTFRKRILCSSSLQLFVFSIYMSVTGGVVTLENTAVNLHFINI